MSIKKRLLIISSAYVLPSSIASVRPRKLAKYLHMKDAYDISVLTVAGNKFWKFNIDLSITEKDSFISYFTLVTMPNSLERLKKIWNALSFWKKRKKESGTESSAAAAAQTEYPSGKFAKFAEYTLNYLDDMTFCRRAKRRIRKDKLWDTDIVFSTYGPHSVHYIARYIKKKNPKVFWDADFRDPVCRYNTPGPFRPYAKKFIKKICKNADIITAVTQGILEVSDLPDVPSFEITNGFDPDDKSEVMASAGKTDKLTFAYTGGLYINKSDLTAVFRALRELIDENKVDDTKVRLVYAGNCGKEFMRQTALYNLQSISYSYGFIGRDKALEIQKNSSILIASHWSDFGGTGNYSGKFFEYMMMKKPVLSVMAGEFADGILRGIFERSSLGFYYEEVNDKQDYALLKDYILRQYNHFIEQGTVMFEPVEAEVQKFNYSNIAKRLDELFKGHEL